MVSELTQLCRQEEMAVDMPQEDAKDEEPSTTITSDTTSPCQRQCPRGRINKIIYLGPGYAGIQDRGYILQQLMDIAGYLCAIIYMRPPSFHLGEQHNEGRFVSTQLQWSDLWDVNFHDGAPLLYTLHVPDNYTSTPRNDREFRLTDKIKQDLVYNVLQMPHNATRVYQSKVEKKVIRVFAQLDAFVQEQQSSTSTDEENFVWALNINLYDWYQSHFKPHLHSLGDNPSKPGLCKYGSGPKPSRWIRHIAEQLWNDIYERFSDGVDHYGHFHVRRGDAIAQCNTSLPMLQQVMECSTRNVTQRLGFLFSSDERDVTYRDQVRRMVEAQGHVWVDLDALIHQQMTRLVHPVLHNNYIVFSVLNAVTGWDQERIHFRVIRRRSMCWDCPKLSEVLKPFTGTTNAQ